MCIRDRLSSGARPVVLVELGEGRYQPREVRLGLRGDEYVQVLEGLADQERVCLLYTSRCV